MRFVSFFSLSVLDQLNMCMKLGHRIRGFHNKTIFDISGHKMDENLCQIQAFRAKLANTISIKKKWSEIVNVSIAEKISYKIEKRNWQFSESLIVKYNFYLLRAYMNHSLH